MKKLAVVFMTVALMGTMSCSEKKVDTETLCAERVAAAVQAATDSIMASQPQKTKKTIVCRAVVKKGQEAAFIKLAKTLVEATRQEPGNVSYNFYQTPGESTSFIFYEEYKNDDAFNAHANSDHFKAFANGIKDLVDGDLNIEQF